MAASRTINLYEVLEQVDVKDAPGDSADFLDRHKLDTATLNVNLSQSFLPLARLIIALSSG